MLFVCFVADWVGVLWVLGVCIWLCLSWIGFGWFGELLICWCWFVVWVGLWVEVFDLCLLCLLWFGYGFDCLCFVWVLVVGVLVWWLVV